MKRQPIAALTGVVLGAVFLLAGPLLRPAPQLLYNPSESAERGWYRVYPGEGVGRGSLVAARLPEHASELADARGYLPAGLPVIKTVGASAGEWICWSQTAAVLPGGARLELLERDSAGRPLPAPDVGCMVLSSDEVFLVSDRTETSFDSRYFGPVDASAIIGPACFLGAGWRAAAAEWITGGDHRRGAGDCKIKARSAETGLEPCLHIGSGSADVYFAAPGFYPYAPYFRDFWQRYFTDDPIASRIRR